VKAFNSIGAEHLSQPTRCGEPAQIFTCSDDAQAREIVDHLIRDLGLVPVALGPLSNARLSEALARTWIWLAHPLGHGRDFALNMVHAGADR
jgi:8-hydroxy-5-deazaflavin:NADPH oxidoreductase